MTPRVRRIVPGRVGLYAEDLATGAKLAWRAANASPCAVPSRLGWPTGQNVVWKNVAAGQALQNLLFALLQLGLNLRAVVSDLLDRRFDGCLRHAHLLSLILDLARHLTSILGQTPGRVRRLRRRWLLGRGTCERGFDLRSFHCGLRDTHLLPFDATSYGARRTPTAGPGGVREPCASWLRLSSREPSSLSPSFPPESPADRRHLSMTKCLATRGRWASPLVRLTLMVDRRRAFLGPPEAVADGRRQCLFRPTWLSYRPKPPLRSVKMAGRVTIVGQTQREQQCRHPLPPVRHLHSSSTGSITPALQTSLQSLVVNWPAPGRRCWRRPSATGGRSTAVRQTFFGATGGSCGPARNSGRSSVPTRPSALGLAALMKSTAIYVWRDQIATIPPHLTLCFARQSVRVGV